MTTLTLKNLYCIETEDWLGADEPYLRVNGSTKWRGSLNDEQDVDLFNKSGNPLTVLFNKQATISLHDQDFGWFDDDDFLGSWKVSSQDVGSGDQQAFFNRDGANYLLTYEVTT